MGEGEREVRTVGVNGCPATGRNPADAFFCIIPRLGITLGEIVVVVLG